MKKLWLLSPFILSMLASPLCSDEIEAASFDTSEISKGFVIGQSRQKKTKVDKSGCTTCCTPETHYRLPADFWGIDTFVEYLLWQVQEQNSYFVLNDTPSTYDNNFPHTLNQGTFRSQRFDWASGVRAGFGYSFGRDTWQLLGQYTWYSTEGKSAYTAQTPIINSSFVPVGTNYLFPTIYTPRNNGIARASSSASFSYQMADLLLSSAFLATDQIQFNYSLGLTGGYIKENWDVTYIQAPTPFIANNAYWHTHWHFGGGGLRAGMDTNWHMGRGFGLFGKISFAAILGQYKNEARLSTDGILGGGAGTNSPSTEYATYRGIMLLPASQYIFGFDWNKSFSNCWISNIKVALSGEFNYLPNLQQTYAGWYLNEPTQDKPTTLDTGNVYMYGGTAHLGADF